MDRNFGGIIWTNHAIDRLIERGIKQGDAWATFQHPEQSRYAATHGGWIYYRTYGNQRIEVVAKQNERKEWIIISAWSQPVYPGLKSTSGQVSQHSLLEKILKLLFGGLQKKFNRPNQK